MNARSEQLASTVDRQWPLRAAPLVSIGLPVYNGERFLAQALDSLLGQTLGDLELIISDNASTDRTAEICKDYAARDARIRYIRQESNRGAIWNFNFVALQARGQYFKWAPANDFCDPQLLEKCVGVLRSNPGAVLCYGRTCIVNEDTDERTPYADDVSATDRRPSERFMVVASLRLNNPLFGVMRLDVLRRTPLNRRYFGGDQVFTIELALYGAFVLLPEILVYRRFGSRTWSVRLSRTDMRIFYFGDSSRGPGFARLRRRVDLFQAVLRAPISGSEKLRTLLLAANHSLSVRFRPRIAGAGDSPHRMSP
jgi:glycosyltransferase involved in cell wall biosynthesis